MKWSLVIALLAWSLPAHAQIRPDRTLPSHSIAIPNGNTIEITGGTTAGRNLFHSFAQFDLRRGAIAHIQNAGAIANIFSRVTGTAPSRINGTIRTNGTANLFLLNPNGILFGPDAALNIGGSFLATTANRIDFADGAVFSAVSTSATPLLTLSAPIGLQFGRSPGAIINQSVTQVAQPLGTNDPFVGLSVNPGRTLALMGGTINLPGGELTAPGGHIELGSVDSASLVQLAATATGWQFSYPDVLAFGTIALLDLADVDASGEGGGRIRLQGDRIEIIDSVVKANTLGNQTGDGIVIRAAQLIMRDGAQLSVNTSAAGEGGNLSVVASDSIELSGVQRRRGEPVLINDRPSGVSGLFARVEVGATARRGGNIAIATDHLRLLAGAQISTGTSSSGDAGTITVQASEVELAGVVRFTNGQPVLNQRGLGFPSTLSTVSFADGRSGDVAIATDRLRLRDGATIQTSTQGSGDAGNLQIQATESIELIGTLNSPMGRPPNPTALLTFSGGIPNVLGGSNNPNATGRGGTLSITTRDFSVRDGAVAAVGSLNPNPEVAAGNLHIEATTLRLDRQAALLANTNSGNGGRAMIRVDDALVLRHNSAISTTAGIAGRGGNGGNMQLSADFILSVLAENNDITANAFTGGGGNIEIATQSLVGILPQPRQTVESDITASSEFGNSGAIVISNPTIDPSQGLVALPASLTDASTQIAQTCSSQASDRQISEFVVTGRGGLPPSPSDSRSSMAILTQWATLDRQPSTLPTPKPSDSTQMTALSRDALLVPLIEAQGWITGADGAVYLVATAPTTRMQPLAIAPDHCD